MKRNAGVLRRILRSRAICITLIYAVVATVWIFFSDIMVKWLGGGADLITRHQTIKGLFFVAATSLMLLLLIRWSEAKLRASEAEHRRLIDGMSASFLYRHDIEGVFTYVSPSITDVLGFTREEFLTHFAEYMTDDPANERARKHTQLSIEGVLQPPYEVRTLHKDGSLRWLEISESPIRDSAGRVTAVEGIAHDITDRKQASEALRLTQTAIDVNADEIYWVRSDGSLGYANDQACRVLGYTREELLTMSVSDLVLEFGPETGPEPWRKLWNEVRRDGSVLVETHHRTRSGRVYPVEVRTNYVEAGGQEYMFAFARDITERKRASEALRLTQTAADIAADELYWGRRDGSFAYVNDRACRATGYPREELLALSVQGLVLEYSPEAKGEAWDELWARLRNEGSVLDELHHRTKSGRVYPVEVRLNYVQAAGEEYIFAFVRDITDRKQASEALRLTQTAVDGAADELYWGRRDGSFAYVNDQACQATGYSREELLALSVQGFVLEYAAETKGQEAWDELWAGLRAEGSVLKELHHRTKSGRTYPVEARMNYVEVAGEEYIFAFVRDITERKQAQEEVRQALSEIEALKDRLEAENVMLRHEVEYLGHGKIVGDSPAIAEVMGQVAEVAPTDSTVLILGETGTGKELLAHAVHDASERKDKPLVIVNCAAMPATLIENELFGREKGAYTDALTRQVGRFELADGATIFLDEIGELPAQTQSKLLRVLQEGQFERLGSSDTITVDVRIIAATNRDLEEEVRQGQFREDLFYRLNVFPITIRPLRDRKEDIPALVWAFIGEFCEKMGKRIDTVSMSTMTSLKNYPWPGNVRELRNVIERAMIRSTGNSLKVQLPQPASEPESQAARLDQVIRRHIMGVLDQTGWRIRGAGGAAEFLGLKPSTLESRMAKLDIRRPGISPR